jgi:hypothetical protein
MIDSPDRSSRPTKYGSGLDRKPNRLATGGAIASRIFKIKSTTALAAQSTSLIG